MHNASVRLHHTRATTVRHGRDATILSARINTIPALVGTVLAEDAKASIADLRASFMILHELVLLQKLVETAKSSWGPPAQWTCDQYQELVQSISLAQEKSGSSRLEETSILAEAFQLRYRFEEVAENQSKIRQIQESQQALGGAELVSSGTTSRESSSSVILPPALPRLRCPTIYGYYSTFEQLTGASADDTSPRSPGGGRSSSGALPLTPRSATIAKYAHLYLEDDVRTRKPWSWDRSTGDDLLDEWKESSEAEAQHIAERLCDRFSQDQIYSYINDHTMVLLNPHRVLQTSKFTSIYDEQVVLTYALTPSAQTRLAPHPFAMAKHGLMRLFYNQERASKKDDREQRQSPQSIFLSGESGSGKTELAKELLKYFVLSAQPSSHAGQGSRPKVKLFTSSTKSTTQMRTEETRTMALLEAKGVDKYEIVLLDLYPERWAEMTAVSKSKRIPQVHIDGMFFGFYEKLESLEDEEQLRLYFKNPHAARKLSTVLDSNILLEAFGNATTSMNLNSSRFGKATTLYFAFERHPSEYQVVGCHLTPFLLEKSRVTSAQDGVLAAEASHSEANFHVFYALVAGVNSAPFMHLLAKDLRLDSTTSESFAFLGKCKHKLPGVWTEDETWKKDVERWQHVLDAMNTLDLTADQQRAIFVVLSAILWLGNIDFEWDSMVKKLVMVSPLGQDAVGNVVELLGLGSKGRLESMLFTKHITLASTGESFDVTLEKGQVAHLRDTLARMLYQCVFAYLVEHMNETTKVEQAVSEMKELDLRTLKLVDVFGFENLERNSLEQLCINYLSEKLFAAEEQLVSTFYSGAEIPESRSDKDENSILHLFEHPLGIFASLEELTVLHQGENESWQQEQKKNQLLVRNLYERNGSRLLNPPRTGGVSATPTKSWLPFVVPHSRSPVLYDAREFVKKNSDFQPSNLLEGLGMSSNEYIPEMLAVMKTAVGVQSSHKKARAVMHGGSQVNQFRAETQALATRENDCMPLYMHCVRPNSSGRAFEIDKEIVERQVRSHRLPTQLQRCKQTIGEAPSASYFSMVMSREFFLKRYRSLLPRQDENGAVGWRTSTPTDEIIQRSISILLSTDEKRAETSAQVSTVTVSSENGVRFQSAEMVERLDLLLELRQIRAAVVLQSFARMIAQRRVFQAKQSERTSLRNELVDIYGADNLRKVERTLNKYLSNEGELRAKIAAKKAAIDQEHAEIEQLAANLKALCLSSEGGLRAETVNELLSDKSICAQLQHNESIVAALRDMSLDPSVLTTQLADPALRSFYQNLVAVLQEKRSLEVERAQDGSSVLPRLALEDRVPLLVASVKDLWDAETAVESWSEHRDKLEEIGDDPELLVFHLEDAEFVAVLESFLAKVEQRKAAVEQQAAAAAKSQEAARAQAHADEVEAELLEMLLKVELDESLMAAMRQDAFFVEALKNPELISSMQRVRCWRSIDPAY